MPHPPIKQIRHGSGAEPGISGVFDELAESCGGVASRAVDGLGRPPFTTTVSIDTQLPDRRAAFELPSDVAAVADIDGLDIVIRSRQPTSVLASLTQWASAAVRSCVS